MREMVASNSRYGKLFCKNWPKKRPSLNKLNQEYKDTE